jgi:nuclear GTP-binding protein
LNMYRRGAPVRNAEGKILGGTLMMGTKAGGKDIPNVARIAPDRRWFGNTRSISQNELEKFKEEMTTKEADPFSVVLRRKKIPMSLLQDSKKVAKMNLLETETYESAFGSKSSRKRPKIEESTTDYAAMMRNASERNSTYLVDPSKDSNIEVEVGRGSDARKDDLFAKGQSKRIWSELYKVLDCSDVIIQVVDARNVPGTRCGHIERHITKNASHKQLVIVINKCDLVPSWVTRKWVKKLSLEFPTLAFHASITNSFGKGALISLLRQFGKLHAVSFIPCLSTKHCSLRRYDLILF